MRFYVETIKKELEISGDEYKHIVKVMRLNIGDLIVLFNGDGYNYNAEIKNIQKNNLIASVVSKEKNKSEPNKTIDLFLSLLKGEKMELVCQKITELGAKNLVLFESKNSDRKQGNLHIDRLKKIAISASKQCGRSSVINIKEATINEAIDSLSKYDLVLIMHEKEKEKNLKNILASINDAEIQSVAIIVGPEGGLDNCEVEEFESVGGISVSLGKLIQRAETASISSVAICANKFLL